MQGKNPSKQFKDIQKPKKKVPVPYPKIVQEYNTHMGGVHLADMFIALYRTNMKTHKWYMALFSQMIDISVNNAWLLYRRDSKSEKNTMRLKEFRKDIAIAFACKNKPRIGRPSSSIAKQKMVKKIQTPVTQRPPQEVIQDKIVHCPAFTTKGRCRYCKSGQTSVICLKCKNRLCFVEGRNCFQNFHYTK
uniref:PiggyBac transposable element-derived protein 2 n=1 Tax=Sipha flava TaxID=143950 RepID=A0A2S2Q690_9HEMI